MNERIVKSTGEIAAPQASGGRRVVLVHGATSGPWVFDGWPAQ